MAGRTRLLRSTLALGATSALALALLVSPGAEDVASADEPTTLLNLTFQTRPAGVEVTDLDQVTGDTLRKYFDNESGAICSTPRCAIVQRSDEDPLEVDPAGPAYGKVEIETDSTGNTYLAKVVREGAFADDKGWKNDRLSLKWGLNQPVTKLFLQYDVRVGQSWTPGGTAHQGGGKLPGLCGGTCPAGGRPVADANGKAVGFSARGNFYYTDPQAGSGLSQYLYHVGKTDTYGDNRIYLQPATPPSTTQSPLTLSTSWKTVTHMIKMNTVTNGTGNLDGEMVAWVDGVKVLELTDMRWRDSTNLKIDSMLFAHLFGGGTWSLHAAPDNARIMFDNIKVTTTKPANVS